MNVYEWNAAPGVDRRLYPLAAKQAEEMVLFGKAQFITLPSGRRAVQKLPPATVLAERSARNSIMPFGRGPVGVIKHPPSLHYPIPAVRDYRLSWRYSFMYPEGKPSPALGA